MSANPYKKWMNLISFIKKDYEFGSLKTYRNEEGRLHRDDGPAYISPTTLISYQNGNRHGISIDIWGTINYYFNGILVPSKYMTRPEKLGFEEVISNSNAEVRAVGIRIYGFDRMLNEDRFDVLEIEKDTNYMLLKWNAKDPDESFCLVRVFNGTLNEDGTRNIYYLTVPPDVKSVREAVAWTFYKKTEDYHPVVET